MGEWISVEDRLPDKSGIYWSRFENGEIYDRSFYADDPDSFTINTTCGSVTHWMSPEHSKPERILYRGRRVNGCGWVEGWYVYVQDGSMYGSHRIYTGEVEISCGEHYEEWYEVEPFTVGQFTGLWDFEGTRIFEGDVVRDIDTADIAVVRANIFNCNCCHGVYGFSTDTESPDITGDIIVVGNIYDNPSLFDDAFRLP